MGAIQLLRYEVYTQQRANINWLTMNTMCWVFLLGSRMRFWCAGIWDEVDQMGWKRSAVGKRISITHADTPPHDWTISPQATVSA